MEGPTDGQAIGRTDGQMVGRACIWMDGWTDVRMDKLDGRTYTWSNGQVTHSADRWDRWTSGRSADEQIDGSTDARMGGRTDGQATRPYD